MPVTKLYLIRHGQSAGNAEGRFGGHSATPLSSLGKRQAQMTARKLAKEKIGAIYSSDLLRAVQTAEPLSKILKVEINPTDTFRERHVGVLEGLTFDEAKEKFFTDYNALVHREIRHQITNGESYVQLLDRATAALEKILELHEGEKIAVFAHTGTICFLTLYLLGAIHETTTHTPWLVTSNCGINRFEFRGRDNVRLLALNDTRHLIQVTGNDAFSVR